MNAKTKYKKALTIPNSKPSSESDSCDATCDALAAIPVSAIISIKLLMKTSIIECGWCAYRLSLYKGKKTVNVNKFANSLKNGVINNKKSEIDFMSVTCNVKISNQLHFIVDRYP